MLTGGPGSRIPSGCGRKRRRPVERKETAENERNGRESLVREENKNGRERQTGRRLYFCRKAEMWSGSLRRV